MHHSAAIQTAFESSNQVLTVSLHDRNMSSGLANVGGASEIGLKHGSGYNINIPWHPDEHGTDFNMSTMVIL